MSASTAPTELGSKKISTLLRMYAVPGIIAMTASSLYNMVDSIFIGHIPGVGAYAISGLAVTFPLMNLSSAMGTLVGVGAMTMISVMLGQRNYENAGKILSNVLSLNLVIGILFTVLALCFLEPILYFFGASPNTMPFAKDYITIILIGNAFTHLYFGFNGIIRAVGKPRLAMGLTLFTVISNVILDPVFIYGLKMGIQGAAVATVLCQLMALCYSMRFFLDRGNFLHFPRPLLQLDLRIARQTMAIGLGPFLMNVASCIVAVFINQQLRKYGGDLAIGAYGISNRITFMFVMVVMGLNQGMQPIASYNYGARQYSRVREVFTLTAKWAVAATALCFLVCELIPGPAVGMFTGDPSLKALSVKGLRIMNCGFALVGFGMVTSNLFQCLGMVKISVFLSLSRQLLFLVPMVYLLPLWWEANGVWASFPVSDILSVIVSYYFIARLFRSFRSLSDGEAPDVLGSSIK